MARIALFPSAAKISVPPVVAPDKKIAPKPTPSSIPPKIEHINKLSVIGKKPAVKSKHTENNSAPYNDFIPKLFPKNKAPNIKSGIFKSSTTIPIGKSNNLFNIMAIPDNPPDTIACGAKNTLIESEAHKTPAVIITYSLNVFTNFDFNQTPPTRPS